MDIFISFAISLLYTIILYGAGPLVFLRLRKDPITKGKLKAFSICYTFAVWLGSNIFWGIYSGSDVSSGGAAILWGGIFYAYMKRELSKTGLFSERLPAIPKERFQEQETSMGTFTVDTETGEVVKESNTSHDYSEARSKPVSIALEKPSEKNRKFPLAVCVLSCLCVALAGCSLWLWNETQYLNVEVETLSKENSKLEAHVSDISEKIARKDVEYQKLQNEKTELERTVESRSTRILELVAHLDQIGYVVEGSKYYHRFEIDPHSWDGPYYGLSHFKCGGFPDDAEYWAHNVEFCKYLGYSPCPTCW